MFYEDEKENSDDILSDNIQISEDGVVSWGDVLDDTSEDLISISDDVSDLAEPVSSDESDDMLDINSNGEEPDEDELRKILSEGDNSDIEVVEDDSEIESEKQGEDSDDVDFEFDSSLLKDSSSGMEDLPPEKITPRKPLSSDKQSSSMPVLIALLVAIFAVGGAYWIYTFMQGNDASRGALEMKNQAKEITREDIIQRNQEQEDIPVINEETEDTIQAPESTLETKKEIIDVKVEGRANPFLPKSKYLSVEVPETYVNFENPSIPKPPEAYGSDTDIETALKMLDISVSGIMYDDIKPSAIITYEENDYFVQCGDKLNEYRVIDIGRDYVLIALGRNTYRANVGEEFKITGDFYGNAKYLPTGRQYYTVSDDTSAETSSSKKASRTSKDRTEINVD